MVIYRDMWRAKLRVADPTYEGKSEDEEEECYGTRNLIYINNIFFWGLGLDKRFVLESKMSWRVGAVVLYITLRFNKTLFTFLLVSKHRVPLIFGFRHPPMPVYTNTLCYSRNGKHFVFDNEFKLRFPL